MAIQTEDKRAAPAGRKTAHIADDVHLVAKIRAAKKGLTIGNYLDKILRKIFRKGDDKNGNKR